MLLNKLEVIISEEIKANGPMPIDEFMQLALAHPKHGYYANNNPLGRNNDFITAPEISQLFGEIVGLWVVEQCYKILENNKNTKKINILEVGAGLGTMLSDVLRVVALVPEIKNIVHVSIVEVNKKLIEKQTKKLQAQNVEVTYYRHLDEVQLDNLVVLANEFFDVLPIKQHIKTTKGWVEQKVAFNDQEGFVYNVENPVKVKESSILVEDDMQNITSLLQQKGCAALIIDYGYFDQTKLEQKDAFFGDTLQAIGKHKFKSIFDNIGVNDLTAHVNFNLLYNIASKAKLKAYVSTQADFLRKYGIYIRAAKLAEGKSESQKQAIASQLDRLCSLQQMGALFKVLEVYN